MGNRRRGNDLQYLPSAHDAGIRIVGRSWFFVVLNANEYAVSRAFDATQTADALTVVAILREVKTYIRQFILM